MSEVVVVGSYVQDLAFKTGEFPKPGQTIIGSFLPGPGGKGFNQAVACHRQKVSTLFIGAVGQDLFGEGVKKFAKEESLPLALQEFKEHPTGAAGILLDAKSQNMIVVALGASGHLTRAHVRSTEKEFKNAKVVLVQLEANLEAMEEALTLGKANGAITILNPAPINEGVTHQLLSKADILTPNETEFAYLIEKIIGKKIAGAEVAALSDDELFNLARRLEVESVVITLGSAGSFIAKKDGMRARVPVISVKPVDTTGAGDAFSGGLAAGLVRYGNDLLKAVRYGTVVAGLSTRRAGTAPAMPHYDEVHSRFKE